MKPLVSIILLPLLLIGCKETKTDTQETAAKRWYKGNLHTHSYWSDGDEFPEVILDWYKSKEYQFVALTDHNTIAEGEKWITIREDSLYQNAFKSYLDNYGDDWVVHKIDSGRTLVKLKTFDEYKSRTQEPGRFLVIRSEEITDLVGEDKPLHINATNIQRKIDPSGGETVAEAMQSNIDQILKQREETGKPIMPHINHPNFHYGVSLQDMISVKGERFFEVYNGHPMVHNMGDSTHISTEEMWDLINISYIAKNKPIMYGLATDDTHNYHTIGSKWSNAGRGWVMVQADTLSARSLIEAMENGSFYSTTGVELEEISVKEGKLSVSVKKEPGVSYTITFLGSKTDNASPEEFSTVDGPKASFELTDDLLFVRCKITSDRKQKNPIEEILYEMAWTQPIVVDGS